MSKRIYVGNLPKKMTTDDLKALFGKYGKVGKVEFMVDPKSRLPTTIACIEMESDAQAKAAIQALHQTELGGQKLNVNEVPASVGWIR